MSALSSSTSVKQFSSFKEFYPFYISQHSNAVCRLLHVFGTGLGPFVILALGYLKYYKLMIPAGFIFGYGCAWLGHFVFERNRPATFKYPLWSFMGDWKMLYEVLTFKRGLSD
ncbi:hypothetical protein ABK040_007377 [Willaertia magna]